MLRHRVILLATACLLFLPELSPRAQMPAAQVPQGTAPAGEPALPDQAPPAPAKPVRHHRAPRRAQLPATGAAQQGDTIQAIAVSGNQRIEEGTILSYMLVQPGDSFSSERVDRSLRTLYSTGLFADVNLRRDGNTLVVHVLENPLVNAITFEGNHNIKVEDLRKELTLRSRAVYSTRIAQQDRQHILNLYASKGRFAATVDPYIVRLPQNRVNVIFRIVEGPQTAISRIVFVGNHAFGEDRLRSVVDSREERWWRFFSNSDQFNPERVNYDRELLRRFYLAHGYADFEVTTTNSELSPDRKSFFVTFQISEGAQYHVGKVDVKSELPKVSAEPYRRFVLVKPGGLYNGDLVERTVDGMETQLRRDGALFPRVSPRAARDKVHHKVDLLFDITQGPRVFVERIDITGNSVTRDNVIRREFRFAEGDPLDPTLLRQSRTRINDLGFFSDVKVTPEPGSAPDKAIVNTEVVEKANGELSLGGGYSTDAGILGQAGIKQRNLIGTGIEAGLSGTIAAYESQVDLSITDPYFLERNLVTGADLFYLNNNNLYITDYQETRFGLTLRMGYAFNDHVSQAWTYSLIDRDVNNIQTYASIYVQDEAGYSLLSSLGQTLSFDYRDSRIDAHSGFIVRLGTDFAGLGGDEHYVRSKIDGTYFIPLERFTADPDWNISVSGGTGYLWNLQSRERIIDRFFLGGDNLRGFLDQGVGPHSVAYTQCAGLGPPYITTINTPGAGLGQPNHDQIGTCNAPGFFRGSDSLGGNFIWTQSTELHFPLPVSQDFGISGRTFVDVGGLSGLNVPPNAAVACQLTLHKPNTIGSPIKDDHGNTITNCFYDDSSPRVSAGFGVSWKSPFGLINIDIGIPLIKKPYDQTQILRFGFGTRFQ